MKTAVKKVFISHGHNMRVAYELRDFVEKKLGLSAILLSEQPDNGLTVIEKLERYGKSCDFALIILTADDLTAEGGRRARQNVIHELGFFHGFLGRDRVLLLKQTDVEDFSNISGLIYKPFPDGLIQSTFEDIRDVLTKGSASVRGATIPKDPSVAK